MITGHGGDTSPPRPGPTPDHRRNDPKPSAGDEVAEAVPLFDLDAIPDTGRPRAITRPDVVPDGADPFDQEVADRVPPYGGRGTKTTGVLVLPDGEALPEQDSGYAGPASRMPKPRQGMDGNLVTHVEAHAVAAMRERKVKRACLYVNREPCDYTVAGGRQWGCEQALPHMLRPDETLTVYGPNGYVRVFQGRGAADSSQEDR